MNHDFIAHAEFITMHKVKHTVGITTEWETYIDSKLADNFSGHTAALVGGFIVSLDSVVTFGQFYQSSDEFYSSAIRDEIAMPIDGIPDKINAATSSSNLDRLVTPLSSPFRTNILKLYSGAVNKKLLVTARPGNLRHVKKVIKNSQLATDPENTRADEAFKKYILKSYQDKRNQIQGSKRYNKQSAVDQNTQQSQVTYEFLNSVNAEVSATDSRANETIKAEELPKVPDVNQVLINLENSSIEFDVKRFITDLHSLPSGFLFSDDELMKLMGVSGANISKAREILLMLERAEFIKSKGFVNSGLQYIRTDRV